MDFRDITPIIAEVAKQYQYAKPISILVMIQDLMERIMREISDFLSSLHFLSPGMSDTHAAATIMQILLLGMGLVCVGVLIVFMWSRMSQLNAQSLLAKRGQALSRTDLNSSGWRQEAESLSSKSEWKQACRALYFSMLLNMHEREILEFAPARSNYEYWYALAHHRALAVTFKELSNLTELIWFSNHIATRGDYCDCLKLLDSASKEIETIAANKATLAATRVTP